MLTNICLADLSDYQGPPTLQMYDIAWKGDISSAKEMIKKTDGFAIRSTASGEMRLSTLGLIKNLQSPNNFDLAFVKLMLDNGANPNKKFNAANSATSNEYTPLSYSIGKAATQDESDINMSLKLINLLSEYGAITENPDDIFQAYLTNFELGKRIHRLYGEINPTLASGQTLRESLDTKLKEVKKLVDAMEGR